VNTGSSMISCEDGPDALTSSARSHQHFDYADVLNSSPPLQEDAPPPVGGGMKRSNSMPNMFRTALTYVLGSRSQDTHLVNDAASDCAADDVDKDCGEVAFIRQVSTATVVSSIAPLEQFELPELPELPCAIVSPSPSPTSRWLSWIRRPSPSISPAQPSAQPTAAGAPSPAISAHSSEAPPPVVQVTCTEKSRDATPTRVRFMTASAHGSQENLAQSPARSPSPSPSSGGGNEGPNDGTDEEFDDNRGRFDTAFGGDSSLTPYLTPPAPIAARSGHPPQAFSRLDASSTNSTLMNILPPSQGGLQPWSENDGAEAEELLFHRYTSCDEEAYLALPVFQGDS
jgi:hypothetical protein